MSPRRSQTLKAEMKYRSGIGSATDAYFWVMLPFLSGANIDARVQVHDVTRHVLLFDVQVMSNDYPEVRVWAAGKVIGLFMTRTWHFQLGIYGLSIEFEAGFSFLCFTSPTFSDSFRTCGKLLKNVRYVYVRCTHIHIHVGVCILVCSGSCAHCTGCAKDFVLVLLNWEKTFCKSLYLLTNVLLFYISYSALVTEISPKLCLNYDKSMRCNYYTKRLCISIKS